MAALSVNHSVDTCGYYRPVLELGSEVPTWSGLRRLLEATIGLHPRHDLQGTNRSPCVSG